MLSKPCIFQVFWNQISAGLELQTFLFFAESMNAIVALNVLGMQSSKNSQKSTKSKRISISFRSILCNYFAITSLHIGTITWHFFSFLVHTVY